jgi:hypothetical protein
MAYMEATGVLMMGRWMWHYPAEHVEKLTARCAEKLAAQSDVAKQAKAEHDAAARAAQRAARRAAKKLVKAARRDREAANSAVAPRVSPE